MRDQCTLGFGRQPWPWPRTMAELNSLEENVRDEAVAKIASRLKSIPWQGKIIKATPSKVYINAGSKAGVKDGAEFDVYRPGEALVDPDTGMNLGAESEKIGKIKVTAAKEKFSIARITEGSDFKRGDLEYALADTDAEFDVHMGTDGGDLTCIDCHAGEDHRVRGRGTDLSGTDIPDHGLSCDNGECHSAAPHEQAILNQHAERVYCTVCHIATFAKEDATDMVRDWSTPFYKAEADKYTATITMGKDVEPVIAWYNGTTWEQLPGVAVTRQANGTVGMMLPQGDRDDADARLYAFKLHRGKMPVLEEQGWIIPILVEEFFADGNIDQAVRKAAEEMYGLEDITYEWVPVERYMGIFHEVQPADNALRCLDCHGPDGRLDWVGLGWEEDPLTAWFTPSH